MGHKFVFRLLFGLLTLLMGAALINALTEISQNTAVAAPLTEGRGAVRHAPQAVPSCPAGVNYTIAQYVTTADNTGADLAGATDTGNHCDNCATEIVLPFVQSFYGHVFSKASASANGTLRFGTPGSTANGNTCLPAPGMDYSIMAYWRDLRTDGHDEAGAPDGIYTSLSGEKPRREFTVQWRAHTQPDAHAVSFAVRLYENQDKFDIVYRQVPPGESATVGAQGSGYMASGQTRTQHVQFSCGIVNLSSGLELDFNRISDSCICDPESCYTPTRTPSNTATVEVCTSSPTGANSTCSSGVYGYNFPVFTNCSHPIDGTGNISFEVATSSSGPWTVYDWRSWTGTLPPGSSIIIGSFTEPDVPTQFLWYRINLLVTLNNGWQFGIATTPNAVCYIPTSTPTDTATPTQTPTVTDTPTTTPIPACGLFWRPVTSPTTAPVVATPTPNNRGSYLNALSAFSSSNVWAVGAYTTTTGVLETLVERWNGTTWTKVISPNAGASALNAVAAISANDVWAVGTGGGDTLALHWDGIGWSVVASPNVGSNNTLKSISVVAPNDIWAVGSYSNGSFQQTLIEHWNGTSWGVVTSPNVSTNNYNLNSVDALSANDIWAVGSYESGCTGSCASRPLTIHWDGTQWSIVSSPAINFATLNAVAAISPTDVYAVGSYGTVQAGPNPPGPSNQRPIALHWGGTQWSSPLALPAATYGSLGSALALASNDVWLAGYDKNTIGDSKKLLAVHWNGQGWTRPVQAPVGTGDNELRGLAAVSTRDLWAVGGYYVQPYTQHLIEHYNDPCLPPTFTPTLTRTVTPTPTRTPILVGHVTWQGPPAQPNSRQQQPITLTLKLGSTEVNYASQTTDASGFFTVPLTGLPTGTYNWRAKGPNFLATAGMVALAGASQTNAEMGLQPAGDCDSNNVVSVTDFNILKGTFGKALGNPGYDARGDFNADNAVTVQDFNVQKGNFGFSGAQPMRVGGAP
jgi:hypothetical protein